MPTRIDHAALYVADLDAAVGFYTTFFDGVAGRRYHNPRTGLSTFFVSFGEHARLELMSRPDRADAPAPGCLGWAHLSFGVGTPADLDALVDRLRDAGFEVRSGPRVTGDGYYEAVIGDPEGNDVELVADAPAADA